MSEVTRRNFFLRAAAISAAPVCVGLPENPALNRPVEVDLESPDAAKYLRDRAVDAYVRLEEAKPGDPGQLSGVHLRIMELGGHSCVFVEMDAVQRDRSLMTHCLGWVGIRDVAALTEEVGSVSRDEAVWIRLREFYTEPGVQSYSGATIDMIARDGLELQVCFGPHVFGVLRGDPLKAFRACLKARCASL